jgi:hypothetical protein
MNIICITFFEHKDRLCQSGFDVVDNWSEMDINPPFVGQEESVIEGNNHYAICTHLYEKPEKGEGYFGFWRVKYKNK